MMVDRAMANKDNQAPEIQNMYSLNMPVSALRTKIREEFERHRYVNNLPVVDMLLFQSHAEYQVGRPFWWQGGWTGGGYGLEGGGTRASFEGDALPREWSSAAGVGNLGVFEQSLTTTTGDTKLLEATATHPQILPRGRRSKGAPAKGLHARFLGGQKLEQINLSKKKVSVGVGRLGCLSLYIAPNEKWRECRKLRHDAS